MWIFGRVPDNPANELPDPDIWPNIRFSKSRISDNPANESPDPDIRPDIRFSKSRIPDIRKSGKSQYPAQPQSASKNLGRTEA